MNRNAVVFGATGFLGSELVAQLLEDKYFDKVITVVREHQPLYNPKLKQIRLHDFMKLVKLEGELYADTYFCCIGTTIKKAGSRDVFREVDVSIPQKIAMLAEKLSIPHLIVVSSVGADPDSNNFYLRTKGEMEQTVESIYKGHLVFIRPSLLLGRRKDFRLWESVAKSFVRAFRGIMVGPLKVLRGSDVKDIANEMIILAKNEE